nr:hypothetical protein [Devosia limi]
MALGDGNSASGIGPGFDRQEQAPSRGLEVRQQWRQGRYFDLEIDAAAEGVGERGGDPIAADAGLVQHQRRVAQRDGGKAFFGAHIADVEAEDVAIEDEARGEIADGQLRDQRRHAP